MHDQRTNRAGAPDPAIPDPSELGRVRTLEGEHASAEATEGARGSADVAEQRPGKLSYYTLRAIETEASNAARDNRTPVEACSWPFGSREGTHWLSCYLLAGGAP